MFVGEPSRGVDAEGREVARWDRSAGVSGPGSMRPAAADMAVVAVRMPRSRAALDYATRAAATALRPGGLLLVYGANDEGTGAVEREFEALGAVARTWAVGGRCRVVGGAVASPPDPLDEDGDVSMLELPHLGTRDWVSFPGVFAAGRLDAGTGLLLRTLGSLPEDSRVLDYGAGTGVIGAVAKALGAGHVTLLEPDAPAAEAARRNVPDARVVEAPGWSPLEGERFDLILSNPPYHRGKAETVQPVLEFAAGVGRHLTPGGRARFVVQRRLPVEHPLRGLFHAVEVIADDGPFRVWEVADPSPTEPGEGPVRGD
jgi:16S rRNA (guanine1207-N2)-methyltransferase